MMMSRCHILEVLDIDTLDHIFGNYSNTDYELVLSCTCKTFRDIMKRRRVASNSVVRTSILWVASSINIIRWTYHNYGKIPHPKMVANICASIGSVIRLELVRKYSVVHLDSRIYCFAAMNGHLNVIKWLYSQGYAFDKNVCISAAREGHIHVLEWLLDNNCEFDEEVCTATVGGQTPDSKTCWDNGNERVRNGGHFEALLWLLKNGCPVDYHSIVSAAIRNNHVFILEWMRVNSHMDYSGRNYLCNEAIQSGHLDVLIYLRSHGVDWYDGTIHLYSAALYGFEDIMDYAYKNGCELPEDEAFSLCDAGAYNGHFNVVKWARSHNCPWDEQTFAYAAAYNNIEMVEWLYENGCPWDENTCYSSASFGNLDILKWVRARGCPWTKDTSYAAAINGHIHVIIWAFENGCPWDDRTYDAAIKSGHPETIKWFRNLKYI